MNGPLLTMPSVVIPQEVHQFACDNSISGCLNAVIDLARQAFPSSSLSVSLGQDAEDERHRYVALDVDVSHQSAGELLAGQRIWSEGMAHICPSRQAVYFVLGWQ